MQRIGERKGSSGAAQVEDERLGWNRTLGAALLPCCPAALPPCTLEPALLCLRCQLSL